MFNNNVKIDGKEVAISQAALKTLVEELGTTEEAFIRDFGTSANATRKAQEAAKLRREVDQDKAQIQAMIDGFKGDPENLWKFMEQLGHDPEKLAEERVWKKIQYEKLSPEAREAIAEKRRADAAEKALADLKKGDEDKKAKADADAAEQEIEDDVLGVIEMTKRKADPGLVRRVAEIYESYMLAHKTKPSRDFVLTRLRDMRRQELAEDLEGTDIEVLMNTLPKGFINKLQAQSHAERFRSKPDQAKVRTSYDRPIFQKSIGVLRYG